MPDFDVVLQPEMPEVDAVGSEGRGLSRQNAKMAALASAAGAKSLVSFVSVAHDERAGRRNGHPVLESRNSAERWFPVEEWPAHPGNPVGRIAGQTAPENPAPSSGIG